MPATDNSLLENLESALGANPHVAGRRLLVEHHGGHVVVRGQVGTYYQKQMAQESLLRVAGVEHLENQLEVHWA
jgi:osmotically-inducible protein OsmY